MLDRDTRSAIPGVNISISGTRRGTSTSLDGSFSVTIYYLPVYVNLSHVGYETQRLWLDNVTTPVTVLLEPATSQLPGRMSLFHPDLKKKIDKQPCWIAESQEVKAKTTLIGTSLHLKFIPLCRLSLQELEI